MDSHAVHTILLVQYNTQASSRTYHDYEKLDLALDGAARSVRFRAR